MSSTHTVRRGENLSQIARHYGLRNWAFLYNHPRNAQFRQTHPNPNLIHPGDEIFIPDSEGVSKAPCWAVPVFSQTTENLCWKACGRMMWHWRYRHQSSADRTAGYQSAAGSHYLGLDRGLSENAMDVFYRRLGIRHVRNPTGMALRVRLRSGPVIFTSGDRATGHAMVATCHNPDANTYRIVNPCGTMAVTFGDDAASDTATCTATSVNLDAANIDARLGAYIWHW